jgi:ATP-dependent DNA ligase
MFISEVWELPEGQEWAYEAKLDGYRCLAGKDGRVTLWSRRGTLFTGRFPEVARACEKLPPKTVVDGEVVAIDENGRASFNLLPERLTYRRRKTSVALCVGEKTTLSENPYGL